MYKIHLFNEKENDFTNVILGDEYGHRVPTQPEEHVTFVCQHGCIDLGHLNQYK